EPVMRQLIEWLDEPWDDRILHFTPGALGGRRPGEKRTRTDGRTGNMQEPLPDRSGEGGPTNSTTTGLRTTDRTSGSEVFTSSVGAGRRLPNLPFALLVQATCGKLMRELGY
ncbi:MAG: hypothetical protein JO368_05345, partial [Acidimicrobiales bacterium]|nr:hypothetical protein [Acidimicrobiales bacterium]